MDCVIALRQISVTAQCYSSILFRRQQENPSSRHEGTSIQRREEKSAPAGGRERELDLAPLFICFSLLGPVLCKLGQPGVLFVLPEVLTPVLVPSFVLFLWAFPFLVFQPPPFWIPFSYSTYLTGGIRTGLSGDQDNGGLTLLVISEVKRSRSVVSDSLRPCGLQPTRLLHPWDSSGKNTGVGSHFLLQGILPAQGFNPGLLHYRQIIYHLRHQGSPSLRLHMLKSRVHRFL